MNIFVSGQIDDIQNVRAVQEQLIAAGHRITHHWTRNETGDKMLAGKQAKLDNPEETARRAVKDMQGVIDSEIYVICTDNQRSGKGMYVELGAAIALHKTTGLPHIYLLGEMNHASIFYFHPSVNHVTTVGEILNTQQNSPA